MGGGGCTAPPAAERVVRAPLTTKVWGPTVTDSRPEDADTFTLIDPSRATIVPPTAPQRSRRRRRRRKAPGEALLERCIPDWKIHIVPNAMSVV